MRKSKILEIPKRIPVSDEIELKQLEPADAFDLFSTVDVHKEYMGDWLPFVTYTLDYGHSQQYVVSVMNAPEEYKESIHVVWYCEEFAGLVGFKNTDNFNKKTEIGYWLSAPFQKKGIMTRSVDKLLELAYGTMNMNRVQIKCHVGDFASSNIPKRLGFKFEGIEREGERLPDGKYADIEIFSLLKQEFRVK